MDYDTVIKKINEFGLYQKLLCAFLCIGSSLNSLTSYVLNFIISDHHHRCSSPSYIASFTLGDNSSQKQLFGVSDDECFREFNGSSIKCVAWTYDTVYRSTIVSQFDLVCEKKFYRAYILTSHYIGLLVGSVVCGVMSDNLGRKPVLRLGFVAMLVAMASRPLMKNLIAITIMEALNGFGSIIAYISPFVILTELVGPNRRLFSSFCVYLGFCGGHYILLLIAYFIRDWKYLLWVISIPCTIFLLMSHFVPESPRWLWTRGKEDQAMYILNNIANFNKVEISLDKKDITVIEHRTSTFFTFVKELLKSKTMMYRMLIVCLNWFALNLTYYGISMNVARFGSDVYVNYAASSSAELLGICTCWVVGGFIGRKKFFCCSMLLGSILCLCTILQSIFANEWDTAITVLAMTGKYFVTISFFTIYLYTGELFPTVLRASSLGFASMVGRLGSIASAFIAESGMYFPEKYASVLPLAIYGGVGLLAGILALFLPESIGKRLPNYIKDAKTLNRNLEKDKSTHESVAIELMSMNTDIP